MDTPLLSICMSALESRRENRLKIEEELRRQAAPWEGYVEILVNEDPGDKSNGTKRHELSMAARGKYVCFFDDDDWMTPDYIQSLIDGCLQDPDVVTFDLHYVSDTKDEIQSFRLNYADHHRREDGVLEMMANHLCAWRREIQRCVAHNPFAFYSEDCLWYKPLIAAGIAKTEVHIPRAIYIYQYNPATTESQSARCTRITFGWAGAGIECFRQGNRIFIATKHIGFTGEQDPVEVLDNFNRPIMLSRSAAEMFYVWKVV